MNYRDVSPQSVSDSAQEWVLRERAEEIGKVINGPSAGVPSNWYCQFVFLASATLCDTKCQDFSAALLWRSDSFCFCEPLLSPKGTQQYVFGLWDLRGGARADTDLPSSTTGITGITSWNKSFMNIYLSFFSFFFPTSSRAVMSTAKQNLLLGGEVLAIR